MTPRERALLQFVDEHTKAFDGVCPSYEEIMFGLGLTSKSAVARMVTSLLPQGRLRRRASNVRGLEIVRAEQDVSAVPTDALVAELARRGIEGFQS